MPQSPMERIFEEQEAPNTIEKLNFVSHDVHGLIWAIPPFCVGAMAHVTVTIEDLYSTHGEILGNMLRMMTFLPYAS